MRAAIRQCLAELAGKRVVVGLSGGMDSVVLLHALSHAGLDVKAVHVHHGLSANADAWSRFCCRLCKQLAVPLKVRRVRVLKAGKGVEAAARDARYAVFRELDCDVVALAHHLDDQAETVLLNLLRGAGVRGASGMARARRLNGKTLLRPLLEVPRAAIQAYASAAALEWVEDESNALDHLSRNFIRHRVGPVLAERYPRWREALARAARHFSSTEVDAQAALREFFAAQGLRAPSEAKLVEVLKQLTAGGARTLIEHDGARLRVYRGRILRDERSGETAFETVTWRGERVLPLPALGGALRFRSVRGGGIDRRLLKEGPLTVRLRSGGERLQLDPARPRRTLKNLFQEAGVPPWERERLPLLFRGDDLVWVPGLGIDQRFQAGKNAPGWLPEWR